MLKKGTGLGKLERAEVIEPKECFQETTKPKRDGDTDSGSSDTEWTEIEEAVMNVRPVKASLAKNMGTEEESSVREELAEKQQLDPELGQLVKLRLHSEQRPTIDQLSTEAEGAKRLWNHCLLYTSPSPRDGLLSRMPSSA